jgi:hypothetical protein
MPVKSRPNSQYDLLHKVGKGHRSDKDSKGDKSF